MQCPWNTSEFPITKEWLENVPDNDMLVRTWLNVTFHRAARRASTVRCGGRAPARHCVHVWHASMYIARDAFAGASRDVWVSNGALSVLTVLRTPRPSWYASGNLNQNRTSRAEIYFSVEGWAACISVQRSISIIVRQNSTRILAYFVRIVSNHAWGRPLYISGISRDSSFFELCTVQYRIFIILSAVCASGFYAFFHPANFQRERCNVIVVSSI